MSDQNEEIDDDTPVSVQIELVPDEEIQLRQIAFGLGLPKILLTIEEDGDGYIFKALGSGFESHAELVSMAREHVDMLGLGIEQSEEEEE